MEEEHEERKYRKWRENKLQYLLIYDTAALLYHYKYNNIFVFSCTAKLT